MEVPKNSMIIEATDRAGIPVPRFCYHRKLPIAANCRMCLVDVEKAPKPMPACATPVMDGMKVYTRSRRAIDAQQAVMEFLLINHPLDCPICDQGGECELQDLAMGYGRSVSRFTERKRVVKDKNVGPLIQTDMTRCIHCTRCVRFLEEIAGTSEMGGTGRGDRMEIGTAIETSIDSELSGNIIDLCPVGALTNKPFRYSARAWELVSRSSRALHDGVGSALHYHVRRGRIMRAVPRDDERLNETWLSDRDRYSHFGLYTEDRLQLPEVKRDGAWRTVGWDEAMEAVVAALREVDGDQLGMLLSPSLTSEEYFLARRLADALGSDHVDHRLREWDFSDEGDRPSGFETGFADIEGLDAVLLVGCNIRHEAPILGHRVRKAWRSGARIMAVNPLDWKLHFDLEVSRVTPPQRMVAELASIAAAAAETADADWPEYLQPARPLAEPGEAHRAMAALLGEGARPALFVGQAAMSHPEAAWIRQLARWIARLTGADLNLLPHGGNTAGAEALGAVPLRGGRNRRELLAEPLRAYLLWGFDPELDLEQPARALETLSAADVVVAAATHATPALRAVATVLLPLAAAPETDGSFLNLEGRRLRLGAAGKPVGEARPGWKILRRMGHGLGLGGFDQVDLAAVQEQLEEAGPAAAPAAAEPGMAAPRGPGEGLHRIGEVSMYAADGLCLRASALQASVHAEADFCGLHPDVAGRLGLSDGAQVLVSQGGETVRLPLRVDARVPVGAAWVRAATGAVAC
ncbi:MAG: NADH-quinone oxidoreductase subunit NuoG, partial [Gammaproteobacteria bacterium]